MQIAEDLDVSAYNFISKPFELAELIAQVYGLIF
jgi:DNA-binding response OmpR family regulator